MHLTTNIHVYCLTFWLSIVKLTGKIYYANPVEEFTKFLGRNLQQCIHISYKLHLRYLRAYVTQRGYYRILLRNKYFSPKLYFNKTAIGFLGRRVSRKI